MNEKVTVIIEKLPPTIMIKNSDFLNTWALACYSVDKYGIVIPASPNYTDNPNYRSPLIKEVAGTIEYGEDAIKQILDKIIHPLYPHHNGIVEYINQLTPGTEEFENGRGFHYSYGLRLREMNCMCDYFIGPCDGVIGDYDCEYYNKGEYTEGKCYLDQLKFIAQNLDPFNKRMQAITWIPNIDLEATIVDEMKQSVPCLQRLRAENYYDKYYTLITNWRSRDLFKASMWNTIGYVNTIDTLIKEERKKLELPELKLMKVVEFIDSLHVYEQDWDKLSKVPIDAHTISNCLFI